jgi:hypothetical protein
MKMRRIAVAVALAVLAAGCGSHNTTRQDVSQYILSVNKIEVKLSRPLVAISKANRDFAQRKSKPAAIAGRLDQAALKVDRLTLQLAKLDPPPEAARLQPLLVELGRHEAALAREVAGMATFLPAYSKTLVPLATLGPQLKKTLNTKGRPNAKAAALETFASGVDGVLAQLSHLRAPPAVQAAYLDQATTLRHVRDSARALEDALRNNRSKQLPTLLRAFDAAAIGNQTVAAQQAQIAAIRGYNDRIKGIDRLAIRVHREQVKLQRLLG